MKIRPLSDRVIVKRLEAETKTASGIIIPDAATEKPDQGEIVAVGNGKIGDDGKLRPMNVKVGDKVMFVNYSQTKHIFKLDGHEFISLCEDDIIGVIEK